MAMSVFTLALSGGHRRLDFSRLQISDGMTSRRLLVEVLFLVLKLDGAGTLVGAVYRSDRPGPRGRQPVHLWTRPKSPSVFIAKMDILPEVTIPPIQKKPRIILHSLRLDDIPKRKRRAQ